MFDNLAPYAYHPCQFTPGLWRHETQPVTFFLTVDNFGINYVGEENDKHLHLAIRNNYKVAIDKKGELNSGMTIKWNYEQSYVEIYIPEYVKNILHKFQQQSLAKPQHAPYRFTAPIFSKASNKQFQ